MDVNMSLGQILRFKTGDAEIRKTTRWAARFHTSATWTKSLGIDPEELGKVKSYSAQVENFFIQAGGRTHAHLPWANMDKEALTLQ